MFSSPASICSGGPLFNGADLSVDTDTVRAAAAGLLFLASEFSGARTMVEAAVGDVGHLEVARALGEFATNWRRHRSSIVSAARGLASAALTAARRYELVDESLSAALSGGGR